MFLPLRDALPTGRVPVITIALILVNVLVFLVGLTPTDRQAEGSTRQIHRNDVWQVEYGAIPCELLGRCANQRAVVVVDGGILDPQPRPVSAQVDQHAPVLTLITSMFLHGGWLHLAFNMLFLWVFGNNVEDAMHPLGFLGFYLVAGMAAGLAQAVVAASAAVPTIGASGAIAAVLGAYLFLYPRARVLSLLVVIPLWLPAWVVVGGWGLLQFVATWQSIFAPAALDGGVAYVAHFAGFALGLAAAGFFAERHNPEYERLYGR
ncbi:MAG: rhomboid family intrarane serine protease [Thermoleophilia bacterium]|nr:rhomboid family intrarane serine protease [Thermoleophilia bacterium]